MLLSRQRSERLSGSPQGRDEEVPGLSDRSTAGAAGPQSPWVLLELEPCFQGHPTGEILTAEATEAFLAVEGVDLDGVLFENQSSPLGFQDLRIGFLLEAQFLESLIFSVAGKIHPGRDHQADSGEQEQKLRKIQPARR